jgi:hypothetical protein
MRKLVRGRKPSIEQAAKFTPKPKDGVLASPSYCRREWFRTVHPGSSATRFAVVTEHAKDHPSRSKRMFGRAIVPYRGEIRNCENGGLNLR